MEGRTLVTERIFMNDTQHFRIGVSYFGEFWYVETTTYATDGVIKCSTIAHGTSYVQALCESYNTWIVRLRCVRGFSTTEDLYCKIVDAHFALIHDVNATVSA